MVYGQGANAAPARMSSVPSCSSSLHWRDEPRASRRNVCPQKHKQDSHDYIARRPCDVRRLRPALLLLVRLQGHVAHDVPLALLAIYRRYGSTVLPIAGCVLGTDLNCCESLGMPPPFSAERSL